MKKIQFIICIYCAFWAFSYECNASGIKERTVEITGTGKNKEEAVQKALIEALAQVTGVYIDSQQLSQALVSFSSQDSLEGNEKSSIRENSFDEKQVNQIYSKAKGYIRSYSILSERESAVCTGNIDVTISAVVNYYESEKSVERKKIAVMLFQVLDKNNPYELQFIEELNQGIVSFLTQTRNYAILDRDYLKDKYAEFELLQGDDVKAEERTRVGNSVGADYILVGSITNFNAKVKKEKVPYLNKEALMVTGISSISWRLINVPTGMIMASGVHDEKFEERINSEIDFDWIAKLARPAGEKIGTKISDITFPILVLSHDNGILTLARGGDSIRVGQQYNLIQYGKVLMNPYTNEAIAKDEIVIGKVEIIDVAPKFSHAKILHSNVELTIVNTNQYIVRLIDAQHGQNNKKEKNKVKTMQPNW